MKQWEKCEDGFTLVEMIITIAISAILVGSIVVTMGYISAGNAKRSAARFNSKLSTAQTETMTREKPIYLYLFKNNGIKAILSDNEGLTLAQLQANTNATEVGGAQVIVKADDGSGTNPELTDTNFIRIAFDKATGAYRYAKFDGKADSEFISEIEFSGKEKFKVTLVKMTGKHVVSK